MKFSGKMLLIIMLKATKNQGFTLSLDDTILGELQAGVQIELLPPSLPPAPTPSLLRVKIYRQRIEVY